MKALQIEAVDLVDGGVVVTYDDRSCAFYEDAVLMTHLEAGTKIHTLGKKASGAVRTEAQGGVRA